MHRFALAALTLLFLSAGAAQAQVMGPTPGHLAPGVASLNDILVNNLHATNADQQAFIRRVVRETKANRLETRLVLAIMAFAQQQNAAYPFPYFEQILRHQAARQGVRLPAVVNITSTRIPRIR